MVDFSITFLTHAVHEGVKKNLSEGNQLRKDKPDINHFDIGCWWKGSRNTYKKRSEHQKGSKIDCDNSLKEERFEEIRRINNCQDKDAWKVGR